MSLKWADCGRVGSGNSFGHDLDSATGFEDTRLKFSANSRANRVVQARKRLVVYIESVDQSREEVSNNARRDRRETICRQLKVLGWTDEDMAASSRQPKPWNSLVEISKPLTDRGFFPSLFRSSKRIARYISQKLRKHVELNESNAYMSLFPGSSVTCTHSRHTRCA